MASRAVQEMTGADPYDFEEHKHRTWLMPCADSFKSCFRVRGEKIHGIRCGNPAISNLTPMELAG
jgi:hypothetical protein